MKRKLTCELRRDVLLDHVVSLGNTGVRIGEVLEVRLLILFLLNSSVHQTAVAMFNTFRTVAIVNTDVLLPAETSENLEQETSNLETLDGRNDSESREVDRTLLGQLGREATRSDDRNVPLASVASHRCERHGAHRSDEHVDPFAVEDLHGLQRSGDGVAVAVSGGDLHLAVLVPIERAARGDADRSLHLLLAESEEVAANGHQQDDVDLPLLRLRALVDLEAEEVAAGTRSANEHQSGAVGRRLLARVLVQCHHCWYVVRRLASHGDHGS